MSILLAIGHEELTKGIRGLLKSNGLDVLEDEVYHRNYLNDKIEMLAPSMVIIHDLYLASDFGSPKESNEQRDNELVELIEYWRTTYDTNLRVVYLGVRDRHDEFIGQLVARNVLDIFIERQFQGSLLVNQLSQPPRYSNVKKFGVANIKVEYLEEDVEQSAVDTQDSEQVPKDDLVIVEKVPSLPKEKSEVGKKLTQTIKAGVTGGVNAAGKVVTGTGSFVKGAAEKIPKRSESPPSHEESKVSELMLEDLLDLMPTDIELTQRVKPAIIGTVLIAVAGVQPHLGSTHTALTISSYLARLGHSVAVIESNYSQDFDRIHSLYEGSKELLKKDNYFELEQVHHYKYRENFNLNELYSLYEYVVIDYGDLQEAAGDIEEFKRAHVRCVLCSADEWKQHWIDSFLKQNKVSKDECVFLIPASGGEKIEDLSERLNYNDVFAIPPQDNPYEPTKEAKDLINTVLDSYIKSPTKSISKNTLIISCVITALVAIALVMIFNKL